MKQRLLPGIDLPQGPSAPKKDAQWPSTAELLTALAECDLPATAPAVIPERGTEHPGLSGMPSPHIPHTLPSPGFLQNACASACLPWHDVRCVSLHGRKDYTELAVAALSGKPICLFADAANTPDRIARFLLDRGVDWHVMHVFENIREQQENASVCSLPEAANRRFGPACAVLLIPGAPPRGPYLGIPGAQLAGKGGMLATESARAAALADLRIRPDDLVWNLGAGSGAVAIEACALAHRSLVFAIERDPAHIVCIEENRRRFGAANLEIVAGNAPDCLRPLPDPDAVLVGGGLGEGETLHLLLNAVCARLKSGGRLAIRCVLMGNLEGSRAFLQPLGWETRIRCIQISETGPFDNDQRMAALNPIFLISAAKI